MHKKGKARGFTVIELLIVTVIIVTIATVVVVNFNTNRIKSRNTQRKAELAAVQLALELYYDDYGHYPICKRNGQSIASNCQTAFDGFAQGNYCFCAQASQSAQIGNFSELLIAPAYIAKVPIDPNDGTDYFYAYARGYRKDESQLNKFISTGLASDYILVMREEAVPGQSLPSYQIGNWAGRTYIIGN